MSGGRVELGIGAGWYGSEHAAYGIPFPPTKERFDRLAEQLAIITGLWETPAGAKFSYQGVHYQVTDSPALPKPAQSPRPPVIVGGHGPRRTPALAAQYADEFNIAFSNSDEVAAQFGRVRDACAAAGRDAGSLVYSAAQVVCCGKDEAICPAARRRSAATWPICAPTASPGHRPRSSTRSPRSPRRARRPFTCRCSTSMTSTT
jgi:alkanesulfonate monooxygenase SsuD/methylene tetrahydromethanopterin reductase-like flavin-dependent oxidoreductase (luciferase family)